MRLYPALILALFAAAPVVAADARHPTVVELFQSQGCSSCPPANANLTAIAGRRDILALNFAVTYWDQLGWKDGFARPEYAARQWSYAKAAGRGQVYTPQIIVNGRQAIVGARRPQLDQAIIAGDRGTTGPTIRVQRTALVIGQAAAATRAKVWFVRYDPHIRNVAIRAGENGGRTLGHSNIVTALVPLGAWNGSEARFTLPAAQPGLARAVLVQNEGGGAIVAAARL
jgi:hypothetical protein